MVLKILIFPGHLEVSHDHFMKCSCRIFFLLKKTFLFLKRVLKKYFFQEIWGPAVGFLLKAVVTDQPRSMLGLLAVLGQFVRTGNIIGQKQHFGSGYLLNWSINRILTSNGTLAREHLNQWHPKLGCVVSPSPLRVPTGPEQLVTAQLWLW